VKYSTKQFNKATCQANPEAYALEKGTRHFGCEMLARVVHKMQDGEHGWDSPEKMSDDAIVYGLLRSLAKGNWVDVANWAMFAWNRELKAVPKVAAKKLAVFRALALCARPDEQGVRFGDAWVSWEALTGYRGPDDAEARGRFYTTGIASNLLDWGRNMQIALAALEAVPAPAATPIAAASDYRTVSITKAIGKDQVCRICGSPAQWKIECHGVKILGGNFHCACDAHRMMVHEAMLSEERIP
jgi:hypothetical protein